MTEPMATFCCPIETEPKTMKQLELNHARGVAVGILKDKEPSEATRIFNEGVKPVIEVEEMAMTIKKKASICKVKVRDTSKTSDANGLLCQCCVIDVASTPDQNDLKEPLSAPF